MLIKIIKKEKVKYIKYKSKIKLLEQVDIKKPGNVIVTSDINSLDSSLLSE